MALTLNIASGQVDVGDTKVLTCTPKDSDGNAITPATLTAVFTPPTGSATTKDIDDFTFVSGVYSVAHTFNAAGIWKVEVTCTDASGNSEVETGDVVVF